MRMEENNEVRAIVDMIVPGNNTKRERDGHLHIPKGCAGTVDHSKGCPVQNFLEIKNLGR